MFHFNLHSYAVKSALVFLLLLGWSSAILSQTMTVNAVPNDAYIDISWDIDQPTGQSVPNGVFFELKNGSSVLFSSQLTETEATPNFTFQDSYRHFVGPNITADYTIKVYRIGFGNELLSLSETGTTTAQQIPTLTATTGDFVDRVVLSWTNTSKLTTRTLVYRDGQQIGQLEGTDELNENYVFVDSFSTAANSLVNGENYNYCIQPFYIPLNQTYSQACAQGNTFDIGLSASDGTFTDKVSLAWNDVAAFADMLAIVADGTVIQTLPATATSYDVTNIVPGKIVSYGLQIIKDGQAIVTDFDNGNVPPNGLISGRILTKTGNFALANVKIVLETTVLGAAIRDTVFSDNNGFYEFTDIYYGQQASVAIKPIKAGFTFTTPEQLIPLNTQQPQKTGIDFLQVEPFQIDSTLTFPTVEINNFQTTPLPDQHSVLIEFSYDASNVFSQLNFNIKRGKDLLTIAASNTTTGTISYTDTTGIPNGIYNYEVRAYGFFDVDGDGDLYAIEEVANVPTTYPEVKEAENFTGTRNDNKGVVDLSWTYAASNYEGFKLRRNDELIATIAPNAVGTYEDNSGVAGETYTYIISAFRTVGEIDYESAPLEVSGIVYPSIPSPNNFTAMAGIDQVLLNWELPTNLAPLDPDYNFTGFQILRNEEPIGVVFRGFPFEYIDLTGVPNVNYTYKIRAFKELANTTAYSNAEMANITFPAISTTSNMVASDGTADFLVNLSWDAVNSDNINGFIVYFDGDSIATLSVQQTSYSTFANHAAPMTYEVRPYREVGGQIYTAIGSTDTGFPNLPAVGLAPITNFMASDDLANQVVLTWEYPSFVLADFTIYRDGVVIGTVKAGNRKFCDTQPVVGQNYLYQIKGEFMGEFSDMAADYGKVKSKQRITGIVASTVNQRGMPNVRIDARSGNFHVFTTTDSTGVYCFEDISIVGNITLTADASNADFVENPQVIAADGLSHFVVNFQNNFEPTLVDVTSAAIVDTLMLSNLDCPNGVKLSWTTTNNNYDGFEVMRGVKVVALIQKGQPLFYEDTLASPGVLQTYQVRAYLDGETIRTYTEYFSNALIINNLAPVASLDANVIDGGNAFDIVWSHPCDEHTYYTLERNGEIIGLIPTGESLVFRDSTGVPGALYTYTVKAVWLSGGENYESDPVNLSVNYPVVERIENLTARNPAISVALSFDPYIIIGTFTVGGFQVGSYNTGVVQLNWSYDSDFCDGFVVYRDDELLAKLGCDTKFFIDLSGEPQTEYEYSVGALLNRNGNQLEAERKRITFTYPVFEHPYENHADARVTNGDVAVKFKYPVDGFDGYRIYRKEGNNPEELIGVGTEYQANSTITFLDKTGVPGKSYNYSSEFFDTRNGSIYTSLRSPAYNPVIYPDPAAPINFVASDIDPNIPLTTFPVPVNEVPFYDAVHLKWDHDINENVDGFVIERNNNTFILPSRAVGKFAPGWTAIDTIPKEVRKSIDYPTDFPFLVGQNTTTFITKIQTFYNFNHENPNGYQYRIKSYRIVNGVTYFSAASNLDFGQARHNRLNDNSLHTANYIPPSTNDFNFEATDGTSGQHVELTWDRGYKPDNGLDEDVELYRDSTLIATVPIGDFSYLDEDGGPFKNYLYSIKVIHINSFGDFSTYNSDTGYRTGTGEGKSIHGTVKTLTGNSPVSGATLTATALVGDNYVIRETTTNALGEYFFDDLPFEGNSTAYEVKASFEDHVFLENPIIKTVPANQTQPVNAFFFDETAFVVTGKISQIGHDCGLEGVTVGAISKFAGNGNELMETTKTDADGNYSIVINPNQTGLDSIVIAPVPFILSGAVGMEDTIFYELHALGDSVFTNFVDFPIAQTLNFEDRLTYPVEITVETACQLPISNDRFLVRVADSKGCFSKVYQTNTFGKLTADLPPLDYTITVEDVDNSTQTNLLALDYFKFRPNQLDLLALHKIDTIDRYSALEIKEATEQIFIYHLPPTINLVTGFDYLCDDPSKPAFVSQGQNYSLEFAVTESHNNVICPVKDGFLKITNSAAGDAAPQILNFDKEADRFPVYTFQGGNPNLVTPYLQNITVEYFSGNGSFQGSYRKSIFVEGTTALPGSDVVVIPDTLGGVVQAPIFILRDPPGDGSSSKISAGTTISKSVELSNTNSGAAGLHYEGVTQAIFGIFVDATVKAGGGDTDTDSWEYSVSINQDIETSAGDTGLDADIIVGMGLAMQYGLQQSISIDPNDCTSIISTQEVGFTPGKVNTTWFYTYKQIKGLISQAERDIVKVRDGGIVLRDQDNVIIPVADAIKRYETYINNWEKVLEYHSVNTLPWYTLCTQSLNPNLPVDKIKEWRCDFCPKVGTYDCDNSTFSDLKQDILWTQDLINSYNQVSTAVRHLIADENTDPAWFFDPNQAANPTNYTDPAYNTLYGVGAENITFGSGVAVDRSFSSASASTRSYSNSITFDGNVTAGLSWGLKNNLGFIFNTEVTKVEGKLGAVVEYSYEESETHEYAQENTVGISYTLFDDDTEGIGDQYSVTVIQGATHNHTPYFSLLGGRTSCPVETGAITRDNVDIQLFDVETSTSLGFDQTQRNIDANGTATYYLQLTNNNPFGESVRDFEVFLDNQSNPGGAFLRLGGSSPLGSQIFFDVSPGTPLIIPLTVQRGFIKYQHEGIRIGIRPHCVDGTPIEFVGEAKFVTINTFFRTPCSDISIIAPDNNWIINARDVTNIADKEELRIGVRDYDPSNENFTDLRFEYRRLDTGDDWATMDTSTVSQAELDFYNDQNFGETGRVPTYYYVWNITDLDIPDGDYEVRAVVLCNDIEVETFSNTITGRIDRENIQLFGTPQPADGQWIEGDEISVSFNKNVDCSLFGNTEFLDTSFFVTNLANDQAVPATIVCLNNKLIITTDLPMENYDGDSLEVVLANVEDLSGNVSDTIRWKFLVITHPLYWTQEVVSIEMYKGTQTTIDVPLFNSTNFAVSGTLAGKGTSWLSFPNGVNVPNVGQDVAFGIDARNLEVGEYADTLSLDVVGQARDPQLIIKVKVVAESPEWVVNANEFTDNMNLVSNFRFSTEQTLSTDSLDIISVWIENEIRGVANIQRAGDFHVAYLTIFGDILDEQAQKVLEFRVWDASEGLEYDAFPLEPILFQIDEFIGSTTNPEVLTIDKTKDLANYIPLNQGWTWFSVNTTLADNSVDNWLKSLKKVSEGDQIKTGNKFAKYTDGTGWIAAGNQALETISKKEGYLIYLENGPDTLRAVGTPVTIENTQLQEGWNWVGYQLPESQPINPTLNVFGATDGDVIKTIRQDNSAPFAQYNNATWTGSLAELRPYDAYKININNAVGGILNYPAGNPFRSEEEEKLIASSRAPADPFDETTWTMTNFNFQFNIAVVGEILFNGNVSANTNDLVAAFVGNDLRGVGQVEMVNEVNRPIVSFMIGGVTTNEEYTLYYYNSAQNVVYEIDETLSLALGANEVGALGVGLFNDPYPIEVALFPITVQKQDVLCGADNTGFIEVSPVGALSPTYSWSHSDTETGSRVENLLAGTYMVTVTDTRNIPVVKTIIIDNQVGSITEPTISGNNPICPGDAITLMVNHPQFPMASFNWYDAQNNLLLGNSTTLTLNNVQQTQAIKAIAVLNNVCFSDAKVETITVGQATSATFSADNIMPAKQTQTVTFTPTAMIGSTSYLWSFGDGNTSTDMVATHTYAEVGSYTVSLTTTSANNCNLTFISLDYITVLETAACGPIADLSLANTIAGGDYITSNTITSDGQVLANTSVLFVAAQEITLKPGFSAAQNSAFTARIAPCVVTLQQPITAASSINTTVSTVTDETRLSIAPNPSAGATTISFEIKTPSKLDLSVYDARGKLVKNLIRDNFYESGNHQIKYEPADADLGLFYVILKNDQELISKKLIIVQ